MKWKWIFKTLLGIHDTQPTLTAKRNIQFSSILGFSLAFGKTSVSGSSVTSFFKHSTTVIVVFLHPITILKGTTLSSNN